MRRTTLASAVPERDSAEPAAPLITDGDVDGAIGEAGGDPREAVRALLHDIAILTLDRARSVNTGYRRQRMFGAIDLLNLPDGLFRLLTGFSASFGARESFAPPRRSYGPDGED